MLTKSCDKFYMTYTSFSEPYFFFYCNFWWYWCDIMWTALWNWMNFRVFIYQTDSFLFGHHYLFLTETVGNIWYMYLEELVQFDIPDHWGMTNCIFISFFLFSTSILLYIDCNHAQNQGSEISLSGVPDFFDRNKILSGGDLSHYQVPHCIRVFFYFVWFVFIHHNFQFYFELCTYCDILDIYLS